MRLAVLHRSIRALGATTSLGATLACGSATGGESAATTVDSTGPYPVVRVIGNAFRWTAESLFVVGTSDSGAGEFGDVRSVLLDATHSLYVVDPQHRAVSVFDSTGAFERRLGGEGAGPGEYREPYSLARLGRNLALLDPRNARLTLYDSSGAWMASWPVQLITGGQFIRLYRTPPTFWAYAMRPANGKAEGLFVRYGSTGPTDTIPVGTPTAGLPQPVQCHRPDKGITFFAAPYGPRHIVVPTARGERAAAVTSAYRIAFLSPQGDTVRAIERSVPTTLVTDAEWEASTADWRKFQSEWPTAVCEPRGFPRAAVKPVLSFLFHDDLGRFWVEYVTPEGIRYDVFGSDGSLVGTVEGLPPSGGIDPSVSGDRIAFVSRDSADVPLVRVYRLER
jgi:hypothetical protein